MKRTSLFLCVLMVSLFNQTLFGQYINYAEALQKSLYFYDAEKCGKGISGAKLEWRGDCHVGDAEVPLNSKKTNMSEAFIQANIAVLDPDGNGTLDIEGGYHDAGDHVQFGLPQSYASQTVEWGLYEFSKAFKETGELEHILDITKWASDYYLKCTYKNAAGEIVAFCYQAGEGNEDHNYWGAPELQDDTKYPRNYYFATTETPASDQCAGAAASLALSYLNRKDTEPKYAQECLETAIALYEFAVKNRGLGYSGGFYNSSFDEDEMALAAVWLNIATGKQEYLDHIISKDTNGTNTGYLKKIIATSQDEWQNIWVHSWDTKWGGLFAKLAPITDDPDHWYYFRWNLEYWANVPHESTGDGNFMKQTPAGFSWIAGWGSARYNAAAQFCTLVYLKHKKHDGLQAWAKRQIEYIMGDNPLNRSYIVGYSDNYASHPHHRASHGSSTNTALNPVDHTHVLWGALVGGPGANDEHVDDTNDYIYNEVAIDYNAGLVGALAGHYLLNGAGHKPLANFPALEGDLEEFYLEGKLEQENDQRTQVTISVTNTSVHPPRVGSTLKAQYYFNISELIEVGQSISDVKLEVYYDESKSQGKAITSYGPFAFDEKAGIYYYEFEWEEIGFYGDMDLQFAIIAGINSQYKYSWDPSNDYSRQNLNKTGEIKTEFIPLYVDGKLYSGKLPDGGVVTIDIPVSGVSVKPGTAELTSMSEKVQIEANVLPLNATNKAVTWSSANESIASVDNSGIVTAQSEGVANIIVATKDGNYRDTCIVTVAYDTVVRPTYTLTVNNIGTGTISVSPENIVYKEGTKVTLTATAGSGFSFDNWSGADSKGTVNPLVITMDANKTVVANFSEVSDICDNPVTMKVPFKKDGADEYCLVTSDDIANINSWNMVKVEINGVNLTNKWVNNLPPKIDGKYYIYLEGMAPWSHFEAESKRKSSLSSSDEPASKATLVYPNPSTNFFNLKISNPENITSIQVIDPTGRVVENYNTKNISGAIKLGEGLPKGMYHLHIKRKNGRENLTIHKL